MTATVALDLEWYDGSHGEHLTEVGWAVLAHATNTIAFGHVHVSDNAHLKSRYAPSSSHGFIFGDSQQMRLSEARSKLRELLSGAVVLILHNGSHDLETLRINGIHVKQQFPFLQIDDTGALFMRKTGFARLPSLEHVCMSLSVDVVPGSFHNAGNDAAYTMLCYQKLVNMVDVASPPPVPTATSPRQPNLPSNSNPQSDKPTLKNSRNRRRGTRRAQQTQTVNNRLSREQELAAVQFLESFRDTLAATTSVIRLHSLDTVDRLKECFVAFRHMTRNSHKRELLRAFEQKYNVMPAVPDCNLFTAIAPSQAVYFLTTQQFLLKHGKPKTKISFLQPAKGQQPGIVDRIPNRFNVAHIQNALASVAPITLERDTVGVFPLNGSYSAVFEVHNGRTRPATLHEIATDEPPAASQLRFTRATAPLPAGGADRVASVSDLAARLDELSMREHEALEGEEEDARRVLLAPGASALFRLRLETQFVGFFSRRLVFLLDGVRVERRVRFRVVTDVDSVDLEELAAPIVPYIPKKRQVFMEREGFGAVNGERPPRPAFEKFKYLLPQYNTPAHIKTIFLKHNDAPTRSIDKMPAEVQAFVGNPLTEDNFSERFHALLWCEELQMQIDIRSYDQLSEGLTLSGNYFQLKVPGLAENRPSVLYGDKIVVTVNNQKFIGYVHKVELNSVLLKFAKQFHNRIFVDGLRVDVTFDFSRTCLKRSHRSMDLLDFAGTHAACWMFPKPAELSSNERQLVEAVTRQRGGLLKELSLNEAQVQAIVQISSRKETQQPFVIFGPPGTGKTRTLVEAAKTVLSLQPGARILIAAPSNAAVDLIVQRLSDANPGGFPPSQMIRVNAYTRSRESVPKYIERYCRYDDQLGIFDIPSSQDRLASYKIVCSTLYTVSSLYGMGAFDPVTSSDGATSNFFSHIFVDEAGHATEAEFWAGVGGAVLPACKTLTFADVPKDKHVTFSRIVGNFADKSGGSALLPHLVVVGDPKQLGPIVRSGLAQACQYDISYLERLIDSCEAYQQRDDSEAASNRRYKNPHSIVRLQNNYRSHPAILELYSKTFYDGDLKECATLDNRISKLSWLPNRNEFPLVFHGVAGKDEREGSSPSWFNMDEVDIVIKYIRTLMTGASPPFKASTKPVNAQAAGQPAASKGGIFGSAILQMEKSSSVGLTVADIGIITPYRKQIDKIRLQLRKNGWEQIMVGTVEEFQGGEKKIVILSTVRSSGQWIEKDLKFNIGFLKNPKRFNVSISRAKSLMICVGNPEILCGDPHWSRLVRYCEANNACVGLPPPAEDSPRAFSQFLEDSEDEDASGDNEALEERDVQGVAWRRDE
ncbi:P-loop containing nucleoside triphosphate hydrolase protein [Chytriomyces sp. MP71]|nr:P-loop containing nucleoside triphosphate hydrolase protein [Chytriomyces sp. MP71]